MTINEYQKLAMTTLNKDLSDKDVLINGVMGLCGESGEAIDLVKKWLAQGHELDKDKLINEIGDVAWLHFCNSGHKRICIFRRYCLECLTLIPPDPGELLCE